MSISLPIAVEFLIQNRLAFTTVTIGSLVTILAIVFSISLSVVERSSEKYFPEAVHLYTKGLRFRLSYLTLSLLVIANIIAVFLSGLYPIVISSSSLVIALVVVYILFGEIANYFEPETVLKKVAKRGKKKGDYDSLKKALDDMRYAGENNISLIELVIDETEDFSDDFYNFDQLEVHEVGSLYELAIVNIKELGKLSAKEPAYRDYTTDAINSILEISKKLAEKMDSEEDKFNFYIIENGVSWSRRLWEHLMDNVDGRSDMEMKQPMWIINSLYLLMDTLMERIDELDGAESQIKACGDLMEKIAEDVNRMDWIHDKTIEDRLGQHFWDINHRARENGNASLRKDFRARAMEYR